MSKDKLCKELTQLAELPSISSTALTLASHAVAVVVAVGDLALIVADGALRPLPARVTPTRPLLILSIAATQHRTRAWRGRNNVIYSQCLSFFFRKKAPVWSFVI